MEENTLVHAPTGKKYQEFMATAKSESEALGYLFEDIFEYIDANKGDMHWRILPHTASYDDRIETEQSAAYASLLVV